MQRTEYVYSFFPVLKSVINFYQVKAIQQEFYICKVKPALTQRSLAFGFVPLEIHRASSNGVNVCLRRNRLLLLFAEPLRDLPRRVVDYRLLEHPVD